jgi:hypothetical protein
VEEKIWFKERREEQQAHYTEQLRDCEERLCKMKKVEARQKQLREAERVRKRERAAQAEVAEERGDKKGKWPR